MPLSISEQLPLQNQLYQIRTRPKASHAISERSFMPRMLMSSLSRYLAAETEYLIPNRSFSGGLLYYIMGSLLWTIQDRVEETMREKTHFENSRGERLCGILSNPSKSTEEPMVILCHGFSTGKDGRTNTRLEEILSKHNISTFRFDFFGHGESEGLFEEITISEGVDDVRQALKYLQGLGYTVFGLMGSSFGGIVSILVASDRDEFGVLALKSPVSDYMGLLIAQHHRINIDIWKEKGAIPLTGADGQSLRLNYSFYKDAEKIKGYEAVKKIRIPTLIVHGDEDLTVPIEQSEISASLMSNCRLEIIRGADHIYSQPRHFEKMISLLSQFIVAHFR